MDITKIQFSIRLLIAKISHLLRNHPLYRKYLIRIAIIFGLYVIRNIFWTLYYKYYRYPPFVSLGIPILGCVPIFVQNPEKFMSSIICNDGKLPISIVPLGLKSVVYVNEINAAKKLLKTKSIGTKRALFAHQFISPLPFLFINDNEWIKRRKFIQITFGRLTNSSFVYKTIKKLFDTDLYPNYIDKVISNNNGKFYCSKYCNFIAFYTIITAMFGDKLNDMTTINNKLYKDYLDNHHEKLNHFALFMAYESFIGIKMPQTIFWSIFSAKKFAKKGLDIFHNYMIQNNIISCNRNIKFEWNKLNKHKSIMVQEMIENEYDIGIDEMIGDIQALLTAGVETTAIQIQYGLLMLCKYPDIQTKIFNELRKYDEYQPSLLKTELHFLRAFVHEILRFAVISPSGLPHRCYNDDVEINGYKIYKGTTVIINYLSIHHQQKNANIFDIYRWLDNENKFNQQIKADSFMIFGHSSRDCVGKNVAMQELYAVFSLLILRYVIYNNNMPNTIQRTYRSSRDIKPEIPIYFKRRESTN